MGFNEKMTTLADAIREISGTTTDKTLDNMTSDLDSANTEIAEQTELLEQIATALEGKAASGSIDTSDATATANDILADKTAYVDGEKITGTIATITQATPSVSIDSSGKITATATQSAGYVEAGSKSATKQLAFQPAKTITPTTMSQTAVSSGYYTGGAVTVKGDTNLVASNIKNGVSIFGVSGTYVGSGGSSGDTSTEDGLITRTLTSYTNSRVTTIGSYAFCSYTGLTSISFPAATTIGRYAFSSCTGLTSISFPVVTTIGSEAFYYCTGLPSISFPVVTTIGSDAFYYCTSLTSISFPAATTIWDYAFYHCTGLTSISFPAATTIDKYAFWYCSKLSKIYLTASSVCTLNHSSAFSNTSIWSNKGSIYVPSSLVASYKAATNWAFFSNRIFSAP